MPRLPQETRGAFPNAFFVVPPHDHSKCLKDAPTVAFDSTLQYCPPGARCSCMHRMLLPCVHTAAHCHAACHLPHAASSNQSRIFDTVAGMANDVMGRCAA